MGSDSPHGDMRWKPVRRSPTSGVPPADLGVPPVKSIARVLVRTSIAGVIASMLVVVPSSAFPTAPDPKPVPSSSATIALDHVDEAALAAAPDVPADEHAGATTTKRSAAADAPASTSPGRGRTIVAMTRTQSTARFSVMGVTWDGNRPDLTTWVRTRSDGRWSAWEELHADAA
ncbi:hypothetical protein, partial [Kribbia dieselivorans]|uniref:hypothetical protein n=1 Tax=Kribbia dieselivorans TaxID=331526 RepID=UPI001C3F4757